MLIGYALPFAFKTKSILAAPALFAVALAKALACSVFAAIEDAAAVVAAIRVADAVGNTRMAHAVSAAITRAALRLCLAETALCDAQTGIARLPFAAAG
jgi:hypothetical protein